MELSREMDGEIIDLLCEYLELERKYVFYTQTPLDLSFVFKIQDILRKETELFFEKRVPQRSPQFNEEMPIMDQIEKEYKEQNQLTDVSDTTGGVTTSADSLLVRNWQDILAVYVYEQSLKGVTSYTLDASCKDDLAAILPDESGYPG